MRVIGIAGKSGSGKTTAALMLADILVKQGEVVTLDSMVQPVRSSLGKLLASEGAKRHVMQSLCKHRREDDADCFVKELAARNSLPNSRPGFLVVTDLRFRYLNEVAFCKKHGVIWLVRGNHRPLDRQASAHESEQEPPTPIDHVDRVVNNDRGLEDLMATIREMVWMGFHLVEK